MASARKRLVFIVHSLSLFSVLVLSLCLASCFALQVVSTLFSVPPLSLPKRHSPSPLPPLSPQNHSTTPFLLLSSIFGLNDIADSPQGTPLSVTTMSPRSSNEKDYEKGALASEEHSQMLDLQNEKSASPDSALPSPATAPSSSSKLKLTATTIIPIWIVLSSSVIIYNNYLYNTLQFRFPVFLVTWHLTFAVSSLYLFLFICYGRDKAFGGRSSLQRSPMETHILRWVADSTSPYPLSRNLFPPR